MSIASILRPRILVAFAVAMILSVSAYGFAAANTVAVSNAGSGAGAISGYVANNITYTMDAADPTKIASVDFDLFLEDGTTDAPAATIIEVQFLNTGGTTEGGLYTTCVATTTPGWNCSTSGTKAATNLVEQLRITAHD